MNSKQQQRIDDAIASLEDVSFTTLHVGELFSAVRASAFRGPVKEIGDLVAHQEGRTTGMMQRWVQLKAFQLDVVVASRRGVMITSPIDIGQLKATFLDEVLLYAIDETPRWPMANGMKRDEANRFLRSLYTKLGASVYLRPVSPAESQQLIDLLEHLLNIAEFKGKPVFSADEVLDAVEALLASIDKRLSTSWGPRFAVVKTRSGNELSLCLIELVHGVHLKLWNEQIATTRIIQWDSVLSVHVDIPSQGPTVSVGIFDATINASAQFVGITGVNAGCTALVKAVRSTEGNLTLQAVPARRS